MRRLSVIGDAAWPWLGAADENDRGMAQGEAIPLRVRLERLCPGIGQRLFSPPESTPLPAPPGVAWHVLSLARLDAALQELALATLVQSCSPAVRGHQLTHLAGRLCAERALHSLTGQLHAIGRHPDGAPVWPVGLLGSISHDTLGAVALVAYCRDYRWLGVDVEPLLDASGCQAVREVCLTVDERKQLHASRQPALETTLRFSAKEAYYKAVHPVLGGAMDFLDVELSQLHMESGQFRMAPAPRPAMRAGLPVLDGHFALHGERVVTRITI